MAGRRRHSTAAALARARWWPGETCPRPCACHRVAGSGSPARSRNRGGSGSYPETTALDLCSAQDRAWRLAMAKATDCGNATKDMDIAGLGERLYISVENGVTTRL